MKYKNLSMVLAVGAALAGSGWFGSEFGREEHAPTLIIGNAQADTDPMQGLPPTAASWPRLDEPGPASAAPQIRLQPDDRGEPGTSVQGRVARLFVRADDNILIQLERVPPHLRDLAKLWVEIEFPEVLQTGALSALGALGADHASVQAGDIVAMRIAHKHDPKMFPVRELTRVTEVIAKRDTELARMYELRIAERHGGRPLSASWQPESRAR
jgi:hypothetical protein